MTDPSFIKKEQEDYRFLDLVSLLFVVASIVIAVYYYPQLPEKIPTHFNLRGEPDDWNGKNMVFLLPAVTAGLYGMLIFVIKYVPNKYWNMPVKITPENADEQYGLARNMIRMLTIMLTACFCYLSYNTIQVALGKATSLNNLFIVIFLGGTGLIITVYMILAVSRK
ncbi:MAG: DUF1648 domain-containing protein [Saprospiraceae bacterium]|nr:DUF1648 domain-containing protein [Saprospiraceae bacterium]